jgi:hypothetical protein
MTVPEVPLQQTPQRITSFESAGKTSAVKNAEGKSEFTSPVVHKNSTSRRGKVLLIAIVLTITLGLAFVQMQNLGSTEESSNPGTEIVNSQEDAEPNLEADPTASPASTPQVNPSAARSEVVSVQARFIYTSTGIELIWDLTNEAEIESVEVSAVVNNSDSQMLGRFSSSTQSVELTKEDNVGLTSFSVSVITQSGQKVVAPSLNVRGKFSAN